MIESSQPVPTLQKAASSLRNHTNYNSIAMDQTETVDSEIFSAEEEERPDESTHPIGEENCSSNNSSDTAVVKAGEDIKDASVIEYSPIIPRKPRYGAHSQSLQFESNSCLTEKLRDNCSLPLVLDSESRSPVFKRRQRGGGNLLKTTLSKEQVAKADSDAPGSIAVEAQSTTSSIEPLAEILLTNQNETLPLDVSSNHTSYLSINLHNPKFYLRNFYRCFTQKVYTQNVQPLPCEWKPCFTCAVL